MKVYASKQESGKYFLWGSPELTIDKPDAITNQGKNYSIYGEFDNDITQ